MARQLKKELCILLVDIKNAFGSTPHRAMVDALVNIGVGYLYVDLISDIYTGTSTCLLTVEGLSDAIDILCGVKQGAL